MKARFILPFATASLLALAACDNANDAPDMPDPDAGPPPIETEPAPDEEAEVNLEPTQDIDQSIEEVQQEASETFESIMNQTEELGNDARDATQEAIESIDGEMESLQGALDQQIDGIVQSVEEIRDDNMTDTDKAEVVANARNAAEQAARSLGQSETEIESAGNRAAQRAADILDYQIP